MNKTKISEFSLLMQVMTIATQSQVNLKKLKLLVLKNWELQQCDMLQVVWMQKKDNGFSNTCSFTLI
jgi:thiamine pyrophosphate-dependent acetolactate synthase large subunit-like protein